MDKYINSTKVLDFIQDCLNHEDKISDTEKATLIAVQRYIERTQIEDIAPITHGKWIFYHYELDGHWYECSKCGYENNKVTNYCSRCGAKMDGEIIDGRTNV